MRAGFDHCDQGTPEASWQVSTPLAETPRLNVPGPDARLLVIAAHPDDESLGAGGLIAAAIARGAMVEVIIASDGEASHPRSPTHGPGALAPIRRAEVRAALAALGSSVPAVFLGLPDGDLPAHRGTLLAHLAPRLAGCTHVISPWRGDRHPDHEACAETVRALLAGRTDIAHWQYPIWAWHWADPASSELPWALMRRLDLEVDTAALKRRALAAHRSQHTPLSPAVGDEAILPAHVLAHFA
ncbi:MAG TPA: PIG-L family deacetylase, partial [Mycobacteriales bacterium]|nr:PIG-L family deacetylase [Mycobacteriales bacterium]